jgi:L-ascorbate metabolism protein UlaG (beta-lactamase superfamily)
MPGVNARHRSPLALALCLLAGCTSSAPTAGPAGSTTGTSPPAAAPTGPGTATSMGTGTSAAVAETTAPDTIRTGMGDLKITPVHHGTVMLEHGGQVIVVDPYSKGPVDRLPKADLLLVTDVHSDHFDKDAIARVKKDSTVVVAPPAVAKDLPGAKALENGQKMTVGTIGIEAIPMYNKVRGPEPGKLYHDKGRGNGYVLSLGDKRVYLSGDTECTEEMKALKDIDVAFVCMNLPYTMPPSEAAECIRAFKPKIVYPYHYRESNLADLTKALEGEKGIEVRLRKWY